jgi:hypothetical protein
VAAETLQKRPPSNPAEKAKLEKTVEAMEVFVNQMSDREIEVLADSNRKLLEDPEFMRRITPRHLEMLDKSDKFTEQLKSIAKETRFAAIYGALDSASRGTALTQEEKDAIKGLTEKEIEMMRPNVLTNQAFIDNLSGSQIESINKSNRYTQKQKTGVRAQRIQPIKDDLVSGIPASYNNARNALRKMNPKDLAKLFGTKVPVAGVDTSILLHPEVLEIYTPKTLTRMAEELSPQQIDDLRNEIINAGRTPGASKKLTDLATWIDDPDKGGQYFS